MDSFETYRPLLFSIAYRMLGSVMEAEDIVQETFLRCQTMQAQDIASPKAFLSTILTRLCLNRLESAQHRRETYIGPWLPEPLITAADESSSPAVRQPSAESPAEQAILHESISYAFLVLLETLSPLERAVFILRQVFDFEYAEIAEIVGKEQAAVRQSFSRAKKHIAEHRPRFHPSHAQHVQLLTEFMRAVGAGELDGLLQLLTEDVTMWADGGGKARGAATRPIHGRQAVTRFLLASTRLTPDAFTAEVREVNGEPAAILRGDGKALLVFFIQVEAGRVRAIRAIANPDKLQHL